MLERVVQARSTAWSKSKRTATCTSANCLAASNAVASFRLCAWKLSITSSRAGRESAARAATCVAERCGLSVFTGAGFTFDPFVGQSPMGCEILSARVGGSCSLNATPVLKCRHFARNRGFPQKSGRREATGDNRHGQTRRKNETDRRSHASIVGCDGTKDRGPAARPDRRRRWQSGPGPALHRCSTRLGGPLPP